MNREANDTKHTTGAKFVPRARQYSYFHTVTVSVTEISDTPIVHVDLGEGPGEPGVFDVDTARWLAAALDQAADYIERNHHG